MIERDIFVQTDDVLEMVSVEVGAFKSSFS